MLPCRTLLKFPQRLDEDLVINSGGYLFANSLRVLMVACWMLPSNVEIEQVCQRVKWKAL